MRKAKKQSPGLQLSPGQAAYVLERLIKDRKVTQGDVNRYVSEMTNEISELEARLQKLRSVIAGAVSTVTRRARGVKATPAPAAAGRKPAKAVPSRKRRTSVSPERLASRKLQGRYLALVRQIPANKRPQYAKVAKERGREAAIKEMQAAVGK